MILIGSHALSLHTELIRSMNDTDLVGTYEEAMEYRKRINAKVCYPINEGKSIYMRSEGGRIVEIEIAWPDSMAERLVAFVREQPDTIKWGHFEVPSLDVLYLLKLSHRYKKDSPWFKKTLDDILLMRKLGAKIRPEHEEFFKQREKETYTNSLPKLNVSRADFFDSNVTGVVQIYQHDSVHEAVKHLDRPAYEYFKPNAAEVMCSRQMFEACPEDVKLCSALEEAYVLAIERSLSVFPGKKTPKEAFDVALMKCCTSIASGFWREWCYENYYSIQAAYDDTYYERFLSAVEEGKVSCK